MSPIAKIAKFSTRN